MQNVIKVKFIIASPATFHIYNKNTYVLSLPTTCIQVKWVHTKLNRKSGKCSLIYTLKLNFLLPTKYAILLNTSSLHKPVNEGKLKWILI